MSDHIDLFDLMSECFTASQKAADRLMAKGQPSELAYRYAYVSYIGMLEGAISNLVRSDDEKTKAAYIELSDILTRMKEFG